MITIAYFLIAALLTPVFSTLFIILSRRSFRLDRSDYVAGVIIGLLISLLWIITLPLAIVYLALYKASPLIEKFVNKVEEKLERFI